MSTGYDDPIHAFVQRMYYTIYGNLPTSGKAVRADEDLSTWLCHRGTFNRKAAVVATLSREHQERPETIIPLVHSGADVLRINFSHVKGSYKDKREQIKKLVDFTRAHTEAPMVPMF